MSRLYVVPTVERISDPALVERQRIDDLLGGMESTARRLQEPAPRFLTPNDYSFLRDSSYRQRPALYAVK